MIQDSYNKPDLHWYLNQLKPIPKHFWNWCIKDPSKRTPGYGRLKNARWIIYNIAFIFLDYFGLWNKKIGSFLWG